LGRFWGGVVRVDTNGHGYLLNKERDVARELREAGVDRVSVSLNAHDEDTYNGVCRPQFQNAFDGVLKFVGKAKRAGLETEVTVMRIPEVDVGRVKEMAETMGVRFRVREYIQCFW
jgi:TatD DNase family protein